MSLLKVDGVDLPTPIKYSPGISNISTSESGRTDDAVMHNKVVATKDYYEVEWGPLTWVECASLLNAVDGKDDFEFTHIDPRKPNRIITSKYYVGDRTSPLLIINEGLDRCIWEGISMKFVEV